MVSIRTFSELDFLPDQGITGFDMASVAESPHGLVKFWRIPRGWNIGQLGVKENLHVHRRVFEYAAVLSGRLPHIEYDLDKRERRQIEFVPGELMIRPSGSIHGLNDSLTVQETCQLLYWNTGPGTSLLDEDYAQETADLLDGRIEDGFEHDGECRVLDVLGTEVADSAHQWQRYSLEGEPMEVSVRALDAGEEIAVAELLPPRALFAFLWTGEGQLRTSGRQPPAALEQWTLLTRDTASGDDAGAVRATNPAVWLRVETAQPQDAAEEPSIARAGV